MTSTQPRADVEPASATPEFYIPAAASLLDRPLKTLKSDDTFAVFDSNGDMLERPGSPDGLFHCDTRHLSRLTLSLNGGRLLQLSSAVSDERATFTANLANPDLYQAGRLVLTRETLHLVRSRLLWRGAWYERLVVRNYDRHPHRVDLAIGFGADFRDLFEVRGAERQRRGTFRIERDDPAAVTLGYRGLDDVARTTRLEFAPAPAQLEDGRATFHLSLSPGERFMLLVTVRCNSEATARRPDFFTALRGARRGQRAATAEAAVIDTSNAVLNRVLCRSVADLVMLRSETEHGPYPYAGIPWFNTAFGRDGIITALQTLWFDPSIARGVLRFLAATQATATDAGSAAQPGKILHETRAGEMARLGEVPFRRYYGTVDATPLFVLLAGQYYERTGDRGSIEALWPSIELALRWIDTQGDPDNDGFVEYQSSDPKGLTNQGWKDSADAISHADGSLAEGPIALAEVQAYVYGAKRAAAQLALTLGNPTMATRLEGEAEVLRRRFEAVFWCEDLGTYALALDGAKRPCRVRSSNAGHALFAGIADPAHARRVATTLLGSDCNSGWGIRTLATSERRYNPMSYHNGSVWPHDNAIIALGLARHNLKREVVRLFGSLFEAITHMDMLRPPELFCGFPRRRGEPPTLYPVACAPQAWASAAPLALLQACLGLRCDQLRREIHFDHPMLPPDVDAVRIRRLRLGDARVDLLLRRHANDVAVNVIERVGDARVVVQS